MIKLSSSLTIFLKYLIPIFWVVLFGSLTATIVFFTPDSAMANRPYFKWLWLAVFIGWTLVLYFTLFRLKRVEGNDMGIHISNYFKHIFIPLEDVQTFDEVSFGPFLLIKVKFARATYFGKSVYFLASKTRFGMFVRINADKLKDVLPGT